MPNDIRVKRRALGGASGAPPSLLQSEPAWSEVDQILYIGQGSGGNATVVAIGGPGAYLTIASANSTYLTQSAAGSTYLTISAAGSSYLTLNAAASTYAPLASPNLTGVPLAPTAANGTATNQIATTAFVGTAIDNLIGSNVSAALDTLKELGDALGSDANFAGTVTTALNARLVGANNLNDVANVTLARANLGLGDMALQSSSNVTITGGSLDGVSLNNVALDGGSF